MEKSWFNLTAQEIQPLYYHVELEGQGWLRSRGCPEDVWNGGCSLLLDGLIPATNTSPVSAKYVCVFPLTFTSFSPPEESERAVCNGHHCFLFLLCISQDLLPPCTSCTQDLGEPDL